MTSILQKTSSRANGAKSRGPVTNAGKLISAANSAHAVGPVTPEGKARSSQNAIRHGLLAQSIVLDCEAQPGFNTLLADLHGELQPESPIECADVEIMAVAHWRRMRLWCLEMAQYTHATRIQERANDPVANEENLEIPSMHTALAFAALSDGSRALELLNRYEVRYSREFQRTLACFKTHRADRLRDAREDEKSLRPKP